MAEKDQRGELPERFPEPPKSPEVPEPPKLAVKLPPRAGTPQPGSAAPGRYQKLAVAATAATSFVAPVVVLGVGGWLLDQRVNHGSGMFAFLGTVVGFAVGIMSLLRVIQQLNR